MARLARLSGTQIRQLRAAERISGAHFTLAVSPIDSKAAHFACVVSKKVAARATARNRIKRRCRAAVQRLAELPQGFAYVCTAKRSATEASFDDISRDVGALFSRAKSIRRRS